MEEINELINKNKIMEEKSKSLDEERRTLFFIGSPQFTPHLFFIVPTPGFANIFNIYKQCQLHQKLIVCSDGKMKTQNPDGNILSNDYDYSHFHLFSPALIELKNALLRDNYLQKIPFCAEACVKQESFKFRHDMSEMLKDPTIKNAFTIINEIEEVNNHCITDFGFELYIRNGMGLIYYLILSGIHDRGHFSYMSTRVTNHLLIGSNNPTLNTILESHPIYQDYLTFINVTLPKIQAEVKEKLESTAKSVSINRGSSLPH